MKQPLPANPVALDDRAGLGSADLPGHALTLSRPGELSVFLGRCSVRPSNSYQSEILCWFCATSFDPPFMLVTNG